MSHPSSTVLGMENNVNLNKPEARDDRDWLRQQDRLGNDPQAAMEKSLAVSQDDAPLPEWAK